MDVIKLNLFHVKMVGLYGFHCNSIGHYYFMACRVAVDTASSAPVA